MPRRLIVTLGVFVFATVAVADDAAEKARVAARDRGLTTKFGERRDHEDRATSRFTWCRPCWLCP